MATNTEFTTWNATEIPTLEEEEPQWVNRTSDTLFRLEIDDAHDGQQWKTKSGYFKLIHEDTGVAMWTHNAPLLPDWAHKQQEVNGNKKIEEKSNTWVPTEIIKEESKQSSTLDSARTQDLLSAFRRDRSSAAGSCETGKIAELF